MENGVVASIQPLPPKLKVIVFDDYDELVPCCAYLRPHHKIVAFVRGQSRESDLLSLAIPLREFGFEFELLENFLVSPKFHAPWPT
jgi:hypothetical protein